MIKNYNYGKIVDNVLLYAPNMLHCVIKDNGNDVEADVYNPTDEIYKENGYKPVHSEPYPKDGKIYVQEILEDDNSITVGWVEAPERFPNELERLDALETAFFEYVCGKENENG